MTTARKQAVRLRDVARYADPEFKASLLAGAEALEAQEEWRIVKGQYLTYFIPADRWNDWCAWCRDAEPGEPSAIVPEWAEPVQDDVVITGWRA